MGTPALEHGSSRSGRWLRARRTRIVLWIAVAEGILVAVESNVSRWTVIVIAIPLILLYLYVGRKSRSDMFRQITWIAGASQALAVVAVILAFILFWTALVLAVIFAVIALAFFYFDRR